MKDNEKQGFVNSLNVMCDCFQVPRMSTVVSDRYWNALKDLSSEQFTGICKSLLKSHNKRWANDFPLPAAFLEAIRPEYHDEVTTQTESREGMSQISQIIPRLIAMLPPKGKFNTDEEAEIMVSKMDAIVEEVYKDQESEGFKCKQCDDSGYVYVWVQLVKGVRYKGNEVLTDRVPNSPLWITKLDSENPNPALNLTPCAARCTCIIGQQQKENHPAIPSMDSYKKSQYEDSYE